MCSRTCAASGPRPRPRARPGREAWRATHPPTRRTPPFPPSPPPPPPLHSAPPPATGQRDTTPPIPPFNPPGNAWGTDFGLAKFVGGDDPPGSHDVVGPLRFMAPERFRGDNDRRSDIYALGATLYELLA